MRNANLPKSRVYIREDAFGGSPDQFQPAWLVSVRAMRNRPFCFQAWVGDTTPCFITFLAFTE